ncbi:polymorphic toxin type 37 domain-containing protein [Dorea sp. D27]|uniref:polymorphic toxin type 37 domain-containing protein n=1 Tax=Dorea sp. D27 TaxID=658665 RepID=UPI00067316C9|nr:polymorphic toxin type 37 domain-containing protein [Dorea sp. D27]KMZ54868.1 hypothetical protein HMPREF0980_01281 [Dorea sp. D27]
MGRAQNRKSGYGSIYAGPEYGGYSAYLKNRGRSSQMSLGEAVRNVVRIGSKLVARYEAKSCTTAEKAKKQKGGASAGVLVGSAVGDLLWNSGKAAVVSGAVRASGSAHVIVGGVVAVTVWWMNPIEAGESEEDVEKAQKKWEEAEKSKGESGSKNSEKGSDKKVNPPKYPGNNPQKSPGKGWEWRGKGDPSSGEGNWYNPETGETLHPDLNHPEPIKPHWDYKGNDGNWYRLYPDGSLVPK